MVKKLLCDVEQWHRMKLCDRKPCSDKVTGGKCLVNWTTVCLPKNLGGLGIQNLQMQSISLRVRWLWQQAYDSSKPWIGLPLPVDKQVTEIFQASTFIVIKSGRDTSF
jgi:hypothetical protein